MLELGIRRIRNTNREAEMTTTAPAQLLVNEQVQLSNIKTRLAIVRPSQFEKAGYRTWPIWSEDMRTCGSVELSRVQPNEQS